MPANAIQIAGKTITVEAMPMDDYVKFVKQVQNLQGKIGSVLKDYKLKSVVEALEAPGQVQGAIVMDILIQAPDDFFALLAIALGTDLEVIKKAKPTEVMEAFEVSKKVNDFKSLWGSVKKVLGLTNLTKKKQRK